jgi:acyl-CoA thioester hydrolase
MSLDAALERDQFPVRWPIQTRWADNDHYQHVNNVAYYSYFDTAVNGWLIAATGTDVRLLPERGLVVSSSCDFRRSISFPDSLEVGIALTRLGRTSVTYTLAIFHDQDEPVAVGRFVHVYVNAADGRAAVVPDVVREALASLPQMHS